MLNVTHSATKWDQTSIRCKNILPKECYFPQILFADSFVIICEFWNGFYRIYQLWNLKDKSILLATFIKSSWWNFLDWFVTKWAMKIKYTAGKTYSSSIYVQENRLHIFWCKGGVAYFYSTRYKSLNGVLVCVTQHEISSIFSPVFSIPH